MKIAISAEAKSPTATAHRKKTARFRLFAFPIPGSK